MGSVKNRLSTELSAANIALVQQLLAGAPAELDRLSAGLSEHTLAQPLRSGERSAVAILAHLLHCEASTAGAIYLALLADEPLVPDIHPERQLGRLLRFDLLPFGELLAYFKLRRAVLGRVLGSLTERQWERSISEPGKQRRESVYRLARVQALHEAEHLGELAAGLGRPESS